MAEAFGVVDGEPRAGTEPHGLALTELDHLLSVIVNYCAFVTEDVRDERIRADIAEIASATSRAAAIVRRLVAATPHL